MNIQHTCEALVVHCIDFRFQGFLNTYFESRFPGSYDRIAVPGGVKSLPLEQCKVSFRLHKPNIVILIQHEDCGAYGGSAQFSTMQEELIFQEKELQGACEVLQGHADVRIERYLLTLQGEFIKLG